MKGEFPQSFILSLLIRDSIIALHFCNLLLQFKGDKTKCDKLSYSA